MKRAVAFLWSRFLLGGSEQVCYNTAEYLLSGWGIRSYFVACEYSAHARSRIETLGAGYIQLPEDTHSRHFLTPTNFEVLRLYLEQNEIELLFASAGDAFTPLDRASLPVEWVFWHHFEPLNELREKLLRRSAKAETSLLSWLEYQLLTRPKYAFGRSRYNEMLRSYREQIALSDYYLLLCPEYRERVIRELALSPHEADKILPMINTQEGIGTPRLDKEREIIYMGRLDRGQKRVDRLLRVWAKVQEQLPEWRLRIYGSGNDDSYLRSLAHDLKLARCTFEGRIQYPATAYERAAVLCMTSSYEGYPLALVEAQSHGTIPMAFDVCGGIRHIIGEGNRAGILVEAFDLDAYASSLVALCQDEALRSKLQKACLDKLGDYAPTINDRHWQRILS